MARLYSDLIDGTGRRYYFGLTSAPGGITNAAPAMLTLGGNTAVVQELTQVFRTPATATLTLFGQQMLNNSTLQPGAAVLTMTAGVPGMAKLKVISNALPPDYSTLPDNAPTILFIQTLTPVTTTLTLSTLAANVTQGGNIGYASPGLASLTLSGRAPNIAFFAGSPAGLTCSGLAPTIKTVNVILAGVGSISISELPQSLGLPFHWTDDDPAPASTWTDDPPAVV